MGGILINAGVINYGGLPSGGSGLLAARPAAGVVGRIYIASDSALLYRDTGSAWVTIGGSGPSGSGAAGQATFWTGASVISGDNAFFWDNTNKRLGLGTATPGVRLDIHGTGVIQQINGTTTNNAYLDFQNAGTTNWRLGNTYNAGSPLFQLFYQPTTTNVISINSNSHVLLFNTVDYYNYDFQVKGSGYFYNTTQDKGILFFTNQVTPGILGLIPSSGTANNLSLQQTGGFIRIGDTAVPATMLSISGNCLIGTNTANALYELFVNGNTYTGGLSPTNSTVAVNTAMVRTQTGYVCTATLTLTLPAVSGLNNIFYVIANTGATVTVQRAGADTILDKTGASVTSVTVAAGARSMFYCGGGSITYQIF
jgi:hypothetical protein